MEVLQLQTTARQAVTLEVPWPCTVDTALELLTAQHPDQFPAGRTRLLHRGKVLVGQLPEPNNLLIFVSKPAPSKPALGPSGEPVPDQAALTLSWLDWAGLTAEARLAGLRAGWAGAGPELAGQARVVSRLVRWVADDPLDGQHELLCAVAVQAARWHRGRAGAVEPARLVECAAAVGQDPERGALLIRLARLLITGEDGRLSAGWSTMESLSVDVRALRGLVQGMLARYGRPVELPSPWQLELARLLHEAPLCWPTTEKATATDAAAAAATLALEWLAVASDEPSAADHRRRLVQVVLRAWLGLGPEVQDMAAPMVLRRVFDLLMASGPAPSSGLCALLAEVPQDYVELTVFYIADQKSQLSDGALGLCLQRMLGWPLDADAKASWVSAVLQGVVSKGRLVLLTQAAAVESAGLFQRLAQPELAGHTVGLLETLLGGCQFSPAAFHGCLPHIPPVLDCLLATQPAEPDRHSVLGRVAFLLQSMFFAHPGYPELYRQPAEALAKAVAVLPAPQPDESEIKAWLAAREWKAQIRDAGRVSVGAVQRKLRPGLTGLTNLGNTCYLNSFMQALAATPGFIDEVLHCAPPSISSGFFWSLQLTWAFMKLSPRAAFRPSGLIQQLPSQFAGGGQHDAFEFGKAVLDSVEHAVKRAVQAFTGKLRVSIRCTACNRSSSRLEEMQDLLLPLPDGETATTLDELLAQHFAPEPLEGDSQYRCEACGCLRDGVRQVRLEQPPAQLIMGLNRFQWDPAAKRRRKLLTDVRLAQRVSLPCAAEQAGCDTNQSSTGTSSEGLEDYELYAVVVHSGASAQSGHYYCYAQVGDQPDSWCLFNDQSLSDSSFEAMQANLSAFSRDSPYILFYRREAEQQQRGEMAVHPVLQEQVYASGSDSSRLGDPSNGNKRDRPDGSGSGESGTSNELPGPRFVF